jgi:hypothetical protein
LAQSTDDSERAQIEVVFLLGGGELNHESWGGFAYNYDGPPSYAESDFPDRYDTEYRTVIGSFLFSSPPTTIEDDEGLWEHRATFRSSGEGECWMRPEVVEEERCPLCDEPRGEEHGYVYLGESWAEAVYRLQPAPDDDE